MSITIHRLRLAGLALAATLAACALSASSAHATNLLVCPAGNVSSAWTPALTNTSAPVALDYRVNYGTCVGTAPLTRSGETSALLPPSPRSCTDLLQSYSAIPTTIHWSTGTTSTITGDTNTQFITGGILQTTYTGTVTAGEFLGGHFVFIGAEVGATPLACGTTGVSSATGPATLTITP
jgi:hypothetical protein